MDTPRIKLWRLFAAAILLPLTAFAQSGGSFNLGWSTLDGGGGACAGAKFTLIGTVGQPDAGAGAAGAYALQGGFIPAFTTITGPALRITRSGGGFFLSWPILWSGFHLEAATDLTHWLDLGTGTLAGSDWETFVMNDAPHRFFRLRKECTGAVVFLATDDAGQAAYNSGWSNGQNGGQGFGPWALNLSGPGSGGFVIGDSSQNGSGNSGHINTGTAKSWGLSASGGKDAEAIRAFNLPLAVDSTFTLDMDNGAVSEASENPGGFGNGRVGFSLRSGGTVRFELFYAGTDLYYSLNDAAGPRSSGISFTDGGLRLSLTVTGAGDNYTATITRNGNAPVTFTGALLGSGSIDNVRLYNRYAGSAAARGLYFNSLRITP